MKMNEVEFAEYLEFADELEPEVLEESFNRIVTETKCNYKDGVSKVVFMETQIPFHNKELNMVYFAVDDVLVFFENSEGRRELVELI